MTVTVAVVVVVGLATPTRPYGKERKDDLKIARSMSEIGSIRKSVYPNATSPHRTSPHLSSPPPPPGLGYPLRSANIHQ